MKHKIPAFLALIIFCLILASASTNVKGAADGAIEIHIEDIGSGSSAATSAGISNGDDTAGLADIDFNGAPTEADETQYLSGAERYIFTSGVPSRGTIPLDIELSLSGETEVLANGGVVELNTRDDAYSTVIPLGFTTNIYGKDVDSITIGTNGVIYLNSSGDLDGTNDGIYEGFSMSDYSASDWPSNVDGTATGDFLIAYKGTDLNPSDSTSPSSIRYVTEGISPNQRFVMTLENIETYDPGADPGDMQVKIYETAPAISTGAPADPTNINASVDGLDVTLTWNDNADNENNYYLYYSTGAKPGTPNLTVPAESNRYTITGLDPETEYTFWVSAYSSANGEGNAISTTATTGENIALKVYPYSGGYMGWSVDADGDNVISAGRLSYFNYGTTVFYKKESGVWSNYLEELRPNTTNTIYGMDIAIDGDNIMVGAPNYGSYGTFWMYHKVSDTQWDPATVSYNLGSSGMNMGFSVDMYNGYAITGAVGNSSDQSGEAFIYIQNPTTYNWSHLKDLTVDETPISDDRYGAAVAITDTFAFVSAEEDDNAYGANAGVVYVFGKDEGGADNWGQITSQKLYPADLEANDNFGYAIDVDGDYLAISSMNTLWPSKNMVYVFKNNAGVWEETASIPPVDNLNPGDFGTSLAILGDYLLVGAPNATGTGASINGAAYLYKKDDGAETWSYTKKYAHVTGHDFGYSVDMSESPYDGKYNVIIGAPDSDPNNQVNAGLTFMYEFDPNPATPSSSTPQGNSSSRTHSISTPVKLNLPTELEVTDQDGKPAVKLTWGENAGIPSGNQGKAEIFMDYLNQSAKSELGESGKKLTNVFATHFKKVLEKNGTEDLQKAFAKKLNTKGVNENADILNNEKIASQVITAIRLTKALNEELKTEINNIIGEFADDILKIESVLGGATTYKEDFTKYYKNASASSSKSYSDLSIEILRNGRTIYKETNPKTNTYIDDELPMDKSGRVQTFDYKIRTNNGSASSVGSSGRAFINPQLQAGEDIDVTADINIKIKDNYDILFKEKLAKLIEQSRTNDTSRYQISNSKSDETQSCNKARNKIENKRLNSKLILNYILECHGNKKIDDRIEDERVSYLPPLLISLKLNPNENRTELIDSYMEPIINRYSNEFDAEKNVFEITNTRLLRINPDTDIADLTDEERNIILCNGLEECDEATKNKVKEYFGSSTHSAKLSIEIYNEDENLVYETEAETDIFGRVKNIKIENIEAGQNYTIKVRLVDEDYVLPKISSFTLNTAKPEGNGAFSAKLDLNYTKQFRYGNFDDSDDEINQKDIIAWAKILSENPNAWEKSNLDGLRGIDLSDFITLQKNWGEIQQDQLSLGLMSVNELARKLGYNIDIDGQVKTIDWLYIIRP